MWRGLVVSFSALLALSMTPVGHAQHAPVTVNLTARGETVPVGTAAEDAADDPAIWRNPRRPAASLIVATDKKAGLYVYALDGQVRHFVPAGHVNNVDLLDMGSRGVIVVASDRNDLARAQLQVYRLNTSESRLEPLGAVPGGSSEAYGVCLMQDGRDLQAFSVLKDGTIEQVAIRLGSGAPAGRLVRTMRLATQPEGCVADPRTKTLYVGEEDRGIWAFDARAGGSTEGRVVAAVDGGQLVADVEGLALVPSGRRGGWLIASSQGDNSYALYALPDMKPAGRFRIMAGRVGATQETDGIAVAAGSFGQDYPDGLFVAQDGDNAPAAQNFKLVSWRDIVTAVARKE
ncbi:MAG: hypothetical protein RJB58_962 [Pseudomonadota bacterium]|jgi:3-phytase